MDAILSEGRKIESCRQLETRHRINRNAKLKFGNEARTPARERPLTRERARSNWTQSETL